MLGRLDSVVSMRGMLLALLPALATLPAAPAAGTSDRGCEDIYPAMALGPFPADAATTTPLFYASEESANGSFAVHWTGLACGRKDVSVTAEYSDRPGSATENGDYLVPEEQRTPPVCESGCPTDATITFPLVNDLVIEPPVEALSIELSNPVGGSLDPPSTSPFVLVDDDGVTDRVGLDELQYGLSETYPTLSVAVWRGGPAAAAVEVPYSLDPGPAASATPGADYQVTSPNPLVFAPGDRVELVTLSIINDDAREGDETAQLSLGTPTGAELASPTTKVLTIADNEESIAPTSRLHHPRNGWTYPPDDYRIREIHVFTNDEGGAEVVRAELALRSNLRGGGCAWYGGKRFRPGSCDRERWLPLQELEPDFYFIRMRELPTSARGSITSYTAFTRALDGAGNLERDFQKGRNRNTFDVGRD